MSAETSLDLREYDQTDSLMNMKMRRLINHELAEAPFDFYQESLRVAENWGTHGLEAGDIIGDIGGSDGTMAADALEAVDTKATILCIEPKLEAAIAYERLSDAARKRIPYVRAVGESLPLGNNTLRGVMLHNVIFRSEDIEAFLAEVKRVVEPDGFILISSNAKRHAAYRHYFERRVARAVFRQTGVPVNVPRPPAAGKYLEDIPELVKQSGGLEIVDELYVSQNTHAVITPGSTLEYYLDSIKLSATDTNIPDHLRVVWREVVESSVRTFIERRMEKNSSTLAFGAETATPVFTDPIIRGMYVLRNTKES